MTVDDFREGRAGAIWAALGAVYFFWGTTYLAIRVAVETMPPFLMASVRYLVAGGILYLLAVRSGDRTGDRPTRAQWVSATVIGALLLFGGNGFVTWAEQRVESGIAALMIATVPLWLVVFGRVFLRDRVGWREWVGIALGLGGLALLVDPTAEGSIDPVGAVMLVLAPIFWAAGSLYARRASMPQRALVGVGMQMLAGSGVLAVAGVATGELGDVRLSAISLESTLGLAWLIVFGSIVAFSAYVWLLRVTRTSLVGTYAYVNPVVAVVLGWLVLGERITGRTLIAGGIIVVAVALIVTARGSREDAAAPEAPEADAAEEDRVPA